MLRKGVRGTWGPSYWHCGPLQILHDNKNSNQVLLISNIGKEDKLFSKFQDEALLTHKNWELLLYKFGFFQ